MIPKGLLPQEPCYTVASPMQLGFAIDEVEPVLFQPDTLEIELLEKSGLLFRAQVAVFM